MPILNTKAQLRAETLERLMIELQDDCQTVVKLVEQFISSDSTKEQKGEVLAELLTAAIHLHTHCDQDFQDLVFQQLESQKL